MPAGTVNAGVPQKRMQSRYGEKCNSAIYYFLVLQWRNPLLL